MLSFVARSSKLTVNYHHLFCHKNEQKIQAVGEKRELMVQSGSSSLFSIMSFATCRSALKVDYQ